MSRNAKRGLIWSGTLILVMLALGELAREHYLSQLEIEQAVVDRELHEQIRRTRNARLWLETAKALTTQEDARKEIELGISSIRKLSFVKPVTFRRMPREEIREYIISKLGSQYSGDEFKNYEMALKKIGLMPPDVDLVKMITELLSEQVAAFYDPDTHELYTFADTGLTGNFDRMILAHELVHALQDQNFDFKALALKAKDNDDASLASASIVEGDATYHMGVYLRMNYQAREIFGDLQLLFTQKTDKMYSAPPYMRDSLLFPYQEGQLFVSEVHAGGGIAAVDALFASPPQSSEQVLHPEKYIGPAKDSPVAVTIALNPHPTWKKLHENTVGELGIRSLISQRQPSEKAATAAAGWGGDRYVLYEIEHGKWVLVWKTVWDTEKDAREFFDVAEDFYRYRYQAPGPLVPTGRNDPKPRSAPQADAVFLSVAKQKQCISIHAKTVLFVDAPDEKTIQILLGELRAAK